MSRHEVLRRLLAPRAGRLALAAAASGAAGATAALLLATSFGLLAWAARQPPVLHLLVAIVAVRALALVRATARYGERLAGHDAALRVVDGARRWAWRRLSAHPSLLVGHRAGDTLQALVADLDQVQQLLVAGLVPLGGALVGALVVVGAAATVTWGVAAVLGAGLALAGGLLAGIAYRDGARQDDGVVPARAALASQVLDDLAAAEELAALGAVDVVTDRLAGQVEAIRVREARAGRREAVVQALAGTIAVATVVGVAGVAAGAAVDGRWLAAGVGLALAGFDLVGGLPVAARRAGEAMAAVDRLATLGAAPLPPRPRPAAEGVLLALDGVAVGPPGARRLQPCDLVVRPGDRVAVVGPSGAGKSTLAHVCAGLEPPAAGTVATAGGCEPRDLVGLVPQAPHLLAGTIRDNLRVAAPDADDLALVGALDRVGLADWLAAAPDGLDTALGEAGIGLSAGQSRRLATARALLAGRRVLVMDEPTADLDPATAAHVLADVLAAAADRAVVVVTHDEAVVQACGRVLELAAGRLEVRSGA